MTATSKSPRSTFITLLGCGAPSAPGRAAWIPTLDDEACAFAREKLLRRPDIDVTPYDAYRWIYKVALHRAWVLGRAVFREQPSGSLSGADDDRPEPPGHDVDVVDVVADRVE